ncbi:MAG: hypothetical protein KF866_04750 [Phycisphaeraceae bacterium]|nr:hypothetical protein [Phycisphaeraceae bacterium]
MNILQAHRVWLTRLVIAGACGLAWASTQPESPWPAGAAPVESAASFDIERVLADEIERVTLLDLRMRPAPAPSDYRIADALLEIACTLDPTDAERVRRRLEAAYQCADLDAVAARTRELIRLDPADTVSTLRLISIQMGRLQTVQERLTAYDRFLGPDGDRLDPSIRSRLALDAALLARESGDEPGFIRRLSQAVALDATHKEAAALAATYVASRRPDDRLSAIELTSNLLLADPIDPNLHLALAAELAKVGAFEQARRFHRNAGALLASNPARAGDEGLQVERLILRWQIEGPAAAHQAMLELLEAMRYNQTVLLDQMRRAGVPTTDTLPPEEIRLGLATERLRMLAADAMGDRTAVAESIADYSRSVDRMLDILGDRTRRPAWMTDADVIGQIITIVVERLIIHAWTGVGIEDMIEQLREMQLLEQLNEPTVRAWLSLYQEAPLIAEERFRQLLGAHPLARLGMGLAREKAQDPAGAVEHYRRVAADYPLSVAAAWARSRSKSMRQVDISISEQTDHAVALARQVPGWVDRIVLDPSTFMGLELTADRTTYGPTDEVLLTFTLRNNAPIPLGLGADRPINSRMLVSPELDTGFTQSAAFRLTPEVFDLHRRFRLAPREQVTFTVRADPGFSGWYAEVAAIAAMRIRYRVFQGFEVRDGILAPGPMCLSAQSEQLLRTPLPGAEMAPDALADRLRTVDGRDLQHALAVLRMRLVRPLPTDTPSDFADAVSAAAERFRNASSSERALMLAILPHARLAPVAAEFDRTVERVLPDETDQTVLALAILTRAAIPNSTLLTLQPVQNDPILASLAQRHADRLARDDSLCYARARSLQDLMTAPEQSGTSNAPRR